MFDNYYQAELSSLRELGRSFAGKHPALAGMLSERGTDPDVERLLEGFAFVAARLHQRIDDAVPELIESLLELLLPHTLRPTPAASIVEFRSQARTQRGKLRVERGTRLSSRPARGTHCTFTTAHPLDVSPLRLVASRLDDGSSTRPELTLRFEAEPGTESLWLGAQGATRSSTARRAGLRLHLHGELATTTQLYLWFARHLSGVSVRASDGSVALGPDAVRLSGFDEHEALLPWPAFSAHSARILLEYFTLPAKFLFVELTELERAAQLASGSFEVVFCFHKPPPLASRLPDDVLRLHCVPVVNLFEVSAEPVRAGIDERATLLRAAGVEPAHMEVFSVQSVIGTTRGAERRSYQPFHSFQHAQSAAHDFAYYKLTRRPSPVDDGTHTLLSLQRAPESALARDRETLSIELLCTNRALPAELQTGDICVPTTDVPSGLSFANLSHISPAVSAPLGSDRLWHLLSHSAATRRSLADREVLVSMLSLYGLPEQSDLAEARSKRAKIEAICSVRVETITRVVGGVAARGSLYRVELDRAGFASDGDAFLFGAVLHQVFALDAQVNSFADLCVTLSPSALQWRYLAEPSA